MTHVALGAAGVGGRGARDARRPRRAPSVADDPALPAADDEPRRARRGASRCSASRCRSSSGRSAPRWSSCACAARARRRRRASSLPLLLPDLPVFLRWRGLPPFGRAAFEQLVDVVDRLVVDSREWEDAPAAYAELVPHFERVAVSDIAWARTLRWRRAIAALWPGIREADELHVRGPRRRRCCSRGWLRRASTARSACGTSWPSTSSCSRSTATRSLAREDRTSASDLLSHELDRFSRDEVYEKSGRYGLTANVGPRRDDARRIRPRHVLRVLRQPPADPADAVPPGAGLEREDGGGRDREERPRCRSRALR